MKHLGDITKINGAEIEQVDVITFGSPCQDLSVAGKRAGLEGARSGLFMEAVRIIKEMRNESELRNIGGRNTKICIGENTINESGKAGVCSDIRNTNAISTNSCGRQAADIESREPQHRYSSSSDDVRPRYAVWENVPGAYSSNKGEDFRAVLEELAKVKEDVTIPRPDKGKWSTAGAIMGNGWSIAWRTLDAQYWGVPQRRRRIFLVADFGGQSAPEVLFKREGNTRDIKESGEAREGTAAITERGTGTAIYDARGNGDGKTSCTLTGDHQNRITDYTAIAVTAAGFCPEQSAKTRSIGFGEELSPTLRAGAMPAVVAGFNGHKSITGNICYNEERSPSLETKMPPNVLSVKEPTYCLQGNGIDRADTAGCNGKGWTEDVCYTLNTIDRPAVAFCIGDGQVGQLGLSEKVGTLNCMHGQQAVMTIKNGDDNNGNTTSGNKMDVVTQKGENDCAARELHRVRKRKCKGCTPHRQKSLKQQSGQFNSLMPGMSQQKTQREKDVQNMWHERKRFWVLRKALSEVQKIGKSICIQGEPTQPSYIVRRLTVLECERLQGFPDGWTDITYKGKPASDSGRYKALGNSVAIPCVEYVAKGITEFIQNGTIGSLFDGIGGFPLAFSRKGFSPIWASEIEPFCVAVTKERFGDE